MNDIVIDRTSEEIDVAAMLQAAVLRRGGYLSCLLFVAGMGILIVALDWSGLVPVLVVPPLAGFVAIVAGACLTRWSNVRGAVASPMLGGRIDCAIGTDGVSWRSTSIRCVISWDLVSEIVRIEDAVLLISRLGGFLAIPASAIPLPVGQFLEEIEACRNGDGTEMILPTFEVPPGRYLRWERAAVKRTTGTDPIRPVLRFAGGLLAIALFWPAAIAAELPPILPVVFPLAVAALFVWATIGEKRKRRANTGFPERPPETPQGRFSLRGYELSGTGWCLTGQWDREVKAVALPNGVAVLLGSRHGFVFPVPALGGATPKAVAGRINDLGER